MTFLESLFYMAWRGVAIGLIISAPMGPVGMLCIQRTLDKGRRAGLYTGIGAAISDLFYSLLTGFGLSFIEEFLERNQNIIQLAGSAVLIAFGIYLFRKNPSAGLKKPVDETVSVKKSILGGFLFTFSNPLILFLTIGLFARFNFLLPEFHLWQYLTGFVFIFAGALLWWWFITFSVDKVRSHFNIRSMWLINKIIGFIIMAFAVVGIFTAVSAMATATTPPKPSASGAATWCWNSTRGYGPFESPDTPGSNKTSNTGSDTLYLLTAAVPGDPSRGATSFTFRSKVKCHKPSRSWGFAAKGLTVDRESLLLRPAEILASVMAGESESDGISTRPMLRIKVRITEEGERPLEYESENLYGGKSGVDPTGSLNFFKLVVGDGRLMVYGGVHTPRLLLSAPIPGSFTACEAGYFLTPGASLSPDEIRLDAVAEREDTLIDFESLETSRDPLEGYYRIFDRSLEESLLRLGGDYRFALVKNGGGYDLVYLSGAKTHSDLWRAGMLKGTLRPSGIAGLWDVTWLDATNRPMSHDIKAQTDREGLLTITFPYQSSQIRLIRSSMHTDR